MQLIFRDRFHLKYEGLEKLPTKGGYILSSNHQSYLDPIALASLLPHDAFVNSFAVGTSEIFGAGFMRRLARAVRVVVVDPDANLMPAMRAGAFGLRHGRNLILYPEGERSIDGTPRTFKKGAAILSIHMQVPIVPIAIDGFYEAWPRGKKFPEVRSVEDEVRRSRSIRRRSRKPPRKPTRTSLRKVKERVVEMWKELRGEKSMKRSRKRKQPTSRWACEPHSPARKAKPCSPSQSSE